MGIQAWLSCKKFAERVSRDLDGNLRFGDYPSYFFRIIACKTSRRFRQQMKLMEEITTKYGKQTSMGDFLDADPDTSATLPADVVKRILERLNEENNDSEPSSD